MNLVNRLFTATQAPSNYIEIISWDQFLTGCRLICKPEDLPIGSQLADRFGHTRPPITPASNLLQPPVEESVALLLCCTLRSACQIAACDHLGDPFSGYQVRYDLGRSSRVKVREGAFIGAGCDCAAETEKRLPEAMYPAECKILLQSVSSRIHTNHHGGKLKHTESTSC